ncbi:hypothetical protein ACFLZH_04410 [Patescibacteria group bacterium]
MKKAFITIFAICGLIVFAGCADSEVPAAGDDTDTTPVVEEEPTYPEGPVAFAEVGLGLMDAADVYDLFTFEEGEGTCLDQGFPTNLTYTSDNVVKTADEEYVEDMTMIDFMGNLRFDEVPLEDGPAACKITATRGVTKVQLSCTRGEDDAEEEVCTGTFKMIAQ